MLRHRRCYEGRAKYQFLGGFYTQPKTIFHKLEEHGVSVQQQDQLFKHFLVFQYNAYFQPFPSGVTEKLVFTHRYVSISASVCSNIPGHEQPHCIVESDLDSIAQQITRLYLLNLKSLNK